MKLNVYQTLAALNESLAQYVIKLAKYAITNHGKFNFVLTGGNSPKELYKLLSTTYKNQIEWEKVYFFFGDERTVLPTHKDYNGLMAKENLFDNLQTNKANIFYFDTSLSPVEAAKAYKNALDKHFEPKEISFDLVLLGMGDDAHTASIFPHTELVNDSEATVASVFVEKLNTYRISLTAPLINKAKNVAFITFGENKAEALKHVVGDTEKNYQNFPAQLIQPLNGELVWFVDDEATSLL